MFYLLPSSTIIVVALFSLISGKQLSTPQGEIAGVTKTTLKGREIEAYLGIPFAKPPVGDLRLRSPEPFGSWTGVRDASKDGSICIQASLFDELQISGSEDCLYLSVYTPSSSIGSKLPVMVFIHGGGFAAGGGSVYSPDYLLDKDIVLVIIQYRLGPFGFASTEDAEMPGNYGLKDQVEALRWVQNNIAAYGGDPDSVTLFGHSAGGASVHYLMVSQLAKGLFHRAIPMSGTSHCRWAVQGRGTVAGRTTALAAALGCPTHSSRATALCLRNHEEPEVIAAATKSLLKWEIEPMMSFVPVVEPNSVRDAILTQLPYKLKTSIPMMTGTTTDEGVMRIAMFQKSGLEKRLKELDERFEEIAPLTFYFHDTAKNPQKEAQRLRQHYFGDKEINEQTKMIVGEMYTDLWFTECTTSVVGTHNSPTYLYQFGYKGTHSGTQPLSGTKDIYGVCHGDDLIYLIPAIGFMPDSKHLNDDELKQVDEMVTLWTNFAIHGNPTPNGSIVKWEPATPKSIKYLFIDHGNTRMQNKYFSDKEKVFQALKTRRGDKKSSKIKNEL